MASPHDFRVQRRGRHLKVAAFLNRRDIADTLLTLCIVLRPVTRLQMSLCKHDSPRKRPPTSRPEFAEPPRGHPIAPFRPEARAALATVSRQSLPATVSRHNSTAPMSGQSSLATVSLPNLLEEGSCASSTRGDCALCHRLAGDGATQVTAAEVMVIDGADSLASFTASGIMEGSQQNLWPPHEKPDGTSWHPTPLLEKLSQAEKVRRPGCDRPKSKALCRQEVEGTSVCVRAATRHSGIGATKATRAARRLRGATPQGPGARQKASCDGVLLAALGDKVLLALPMRPRLPRAIPQDLLRMAEGLPCAL